jgi:hypothetical protein
MNHRVAVLGGMVALQLLSCGGDDVPICPTGDCTLPSNTVVKWTFDHYPEWQFSSDSCVDFGVAKVQVDVMDASFGVTTAIDDCGAAQVTFTGLAQGPYTVFVAPLDANGNSVVHAPIMGTVVAGLPGSVTETMVYVPWTAWVGTYTGTFLFRLAWSGVTCASALPVPVVTQIITLTAGGNVVTAMTDHGQRLDGTDPKPCVSLSENFPQSATMLPFGPATLHVVGKDATDAVRFDNVFPTFVGAGISNPTVTYDMVDAGVDAAIDAP